MSGRVWTTGELGELRRLTAQKIANQEIAERLGRTKQAIANTREPIYNATDWNYIRFNVANLQYEMINGELEQYCD